MLLHAGNTLFACCRIIAALSLEERGLFRERIRVLDKRIHPGLTKLTWASKNVSDYFVAECRLHASKIQANVDDYKGANMNIRELCVKISEMLLVRIDSKVVYEDLKFDEDQVGDVGTVWACVVPEKFSAFFMLVLGLLIAHIFISKDI